MKGFTLKLVVIALLIVALAGCGTLRSLTTRKYPFTYPVPDPGTITSPLAGTVVVTSSATITDDLVSKFDKYHGGIDWAGLSFTTQLGAFPPGAALANVTVDFYASETAPVGTPPNVQVPADAVLIEHLALSAATPTISRQETEASPNAGLRDFINAALRNNTGTSKTVYVYFKISSDAPGSISLNGISLNGRAYGSLF